MRRGDATGESVRTPGSEGRDSGVPGPLTVIPKLSSKRQCRRSLWTKGGPGLDKKPVTVPPQQCVRVTPKKARPRRECVCARAGYSAALRRRRLRHRLKGASPAPSLFPLGPVGGARQRLERKGDGRWSFVFPSVPDHGRSAGNLQSSVPSAVDCRCPVLGAGLAPWGERRESRLYTGYYKSGFTEPRESTG